MLASCIRIFVETPVYRYIMLYRHCFWFTNPFIAARLVNSPIQIIQVVQSRNVLSYMYLDFLLLSPLFPLGIPLFFKADPDHWGIKELFRLGKLLRRIEALQNWFCLDEQKQKSEGFQQNSPKLRLGGFQFLDSMKATALSNSTESVSRELLGLWGTGVSLPGWCVPQCLTFWNRWCWATHLSGRQVSDTLCREQRNRACAFEVHGKMWLLLPEMRFHFGGWKMKEGTQLYLISPLWLRPFKASWIWSSQVNSTLKQPSAIAEHEAQGWWMLHPHQLCRSTDNGSCCLTARWQSFMSSNFRLAGSSPSTSVI